MMFFLTKTFLFLCICILASACGFSLEYEALNSSKNLIGGKVVPLEGLLSSHSPSLITHAYANGCSDPTIASLYKIESSGRLATTPFKSQTLTNSTYEFSLTDEEVKNFNNVNYQVEVKGCNDMHFFRPITGITKTQDITGYTTLIGQIVNVPTASNLKSVSTDLLQNYFSKLTGNSPYNAYLQIENTPELKTEFQNIFGITPTELLFSEPNLIRFTAPTTLPEGSNTNYQALATHWNPSADLAYQWKLDGVVVSINPTWNYTPSANSQGDHVLEVTVGHKISGALDNTKPFIKKDLILSVMNSRPAIAPALSIDEGATTAIRDITLSLDTGIASANCESFSSMAITENSTLPPAPGAFTYTCDDAPVMSIPYELLSVGDGLKTIRLWVRDDAGNISAAPQIASITLDGTPPVVSLTSPVGPFRGGTSLTVVYSATDSQGIASQSLTYSVDGGSDTVFTSPWTLPLITSSDVKIKLTATDTMGLTSTIQSASFAIDSTPPIAPTVALTSAALANDPEVSIEVTCIADFASVVITESATAPTSGWVACSQYMTFTVSGEGSHTLNVFTRDAVGNVSTTAGSVSMALDTTPPTVSLTSLNGGQRISGNATQLPLINSQTISWTASDAHLAANPISLELSQDGGTTWAQIATNLSNSGSYTWTVPAVNIDTARIRVTARDQYGLSASAISTSNFVIDSQVPNVSSFVMPTNTMNPSIPIKISATDNLSRISEICFIKGSSTAPNGSNNCWKGLSLYGVTPAASISDRNFYYNLGYAAGTSTIYTYFKDGAGNITLAGSGSVTYTPATPPSLAAITLYSTDTPSNPPIVSDLTAPSSSSIYIKWRAVVGTSVLDPAPIRFFYTTDDVNYQELDNTDYLNSANGSCTVPGGYTGCAALTSPSDGYFKIRIMVKDSEGYYSLASSNPLNSFDPNRPTKMINFIAGNTDLALQASAKSAILKPKGNFSLAVLDDGRIFVNDERGLAWVNPNTGTYEILMAPNPPSTDGTIGAGARINSISGIWADFDNNLWINDNFVLKKINTQVSPMTVTTVLGGGSNTGNSFSNINGTDPALTQLRIASTKPLNFLPNGKLYFQTETSNRIRIYDPATQSVTSHYLTGVGNSNSPSMDNAACATQNVAFNFNGASEVTQMIWKLNSSLSSGHACFNNANTVHAMYAWADPLTFQSDPTKIPGQVSSGGYREDRTSLMVAKTGDVYSYSSTAGFSNGAWVLNRSTYQWEKVLGNVDSNVGTCADGTPVASCPASVQSLFVSPQGQIFYIDSVSMVVRTVTEDSEVITLVGDKLGSANGVAPLSARFAGIANFKIWRDGSSNQRFVVLDNLNSRIREFTRTGTLSTLAGLEYSANLGADGNTTAATTQPINTTTDGIGTRIQVSSSGDVFYNPTNRSLQRLERSTGRWKSLGTTGVSYGIQALAWDENLVLAGYSTWSASLSVHNALYRSFNTTTSTFQNVINTQAANGGTGISVAAFCAAGTALSSCTQAPNSYSVAANADTATNSWLALFMNHASRRVVQFSKDGTGTLETASLLPRTAPDFTFNRPVGLATNMFYYCSAGLLYKYNEITKVETQLRMPHTGITCGGTVNYDATEDVLYFEYTINGLDGVAEYINP